MCSKTGNGYYYNCIFQILFLFSWNHSNETSKLYPNVKVFSFVLSFLLLLTLICIAASPSHCFFHSLLCCLFFFFYSMYLYSLWLHSCKNDKLLRRRQCYSNKNVSSRLFPQRRACTKTKARRRKNTYTLSEWRSVYASSFIVRCEMFQRINGIILILRTNGGSFKIASMCYVIVPL